MKKIFKALKFCSIFLLAMVLSIACEKDFNTIESGVLGKDNANFNTNNLNLQILAYNKKLDSLQINNLSSNLLGVFNDPAFGLTTASIVTQVTPTSFPTSSTTDFFGENPVIKEVILTIPYYSTVTNEDSDGKTYVLDSLYGTNKIKLSIYQNNHFLRGFNPFGSVEEPQNYYSKTDGTDNFAITENNIIDFEMHKGPEITNGEDMPLFEEFFPSNQEITIVTGSGDSESTEKTAPAIRVKLNNDFWKTLIIDKEGDPVLSNANYFQNYFRGLYLKAEAINGTGNMVLLDFSSANITINYNNGPTNARKESPYVLNFTGNRLNTFINNYSSVALANGDKTLGDKKIYLKGIAGSMAVVDLFNGMVDCNGTPETALECFKKTYRQLDDSGDYLPQVNGNFPLKKLINEAHLVIYEDENMPNGGDADFHKYDRIYAYDVKNNIPTIDYLRDPTGSENSNPDPLNSKISSLGQRRVIKDDNGVSVAKYKIRLTEHLNNILLRDSTNTKIGLVLSTNVIVDYNPANGAFKTASILNSGDDVTDIPASALITPKGTVLYGNHQDVPNNRKMKLEIFFTEPNL